MQRPNYDIPIPIVIIYFVVVNDFSEATIMKVSPLRAARVLRGQSLDKVAIACGIDRAALSRLERGLLRDSERTRGLAAKVAIYLGLDASDPFLFSRW